MTSAKTTTFDEAEYREDLVRAGLDPADAAELAAKTASIRNAALNESAMRNTLIQGGMQPEKAKNMAAAHKRFHAEPERPAPAPARVDGFRSVGDMFGPITKKAQAAKEARQESSDTSAAPEVPDVTEKPVVPRKTTRRSTKRDEQGSSLKVAPISAVFDYRNTELPERVRELIETHLAITGGKRGDITRLKHAMTTLFSSVISCHYEGKDAFVLQNVLLADKVDWWTPQNPEEAGQWQSSLMLSEPFFKECIEHILPFDMRAVRGLRQSPLALDIYVWLTYRMSYLSHRTIIPWVALAGQFGSGYAMTEQGLRDFKRAFLRELKHVLVIYPQAKVADGDNGLVLYPNPTHVAYKTTPIQKGLGF